MLTADARRLAGELADAIEAGNTRRVVALVDGCGLGFVQRLEVCRELKRDGISRSAVRLVFDGFDRAHVRAA